jgi:hypothetical protein
MQAPDRVPSEVVISFEIQALSGRNTRSMRSNPFSVMLQDIPQASTAP